MALADASGELPDAARATPLPTRPTARPPDAIARGMAEYGALVRFGGRAIKALPGTLWYFSEILRQFAAIAFESVALLVFMQAMIGITAANFVYFLVKALGAADFTGIGGELTVRTACVSMFGYVFVSKICGGFVAEIGAMKIGQEIAALESVGVDPMRYVVGTRIIASIIFIPIATTVSMISFYFGFYFTAVIVLHGVSSAGLNQFYWGAQSLSDATYVFAVVGITTVCTAIGACFYGMRAEGGPTAIGGAVARAVIVNIVIAHVIGSILVTLWYSSNFGLPIGG
jgi:phospholipid/cholesterol/gamma-HCH transport system permease protein